MVTETTPVVATASYECPLTGRTVEMEVTGERDRDTGAIRGSFILPLRDTSQPLTVTIGHFRELRRD